MDKARALQAVTAELEDQHARMLAAARTTGAAATDPENKAEGKYDTRGLETSYLAAGQGEQAKALGDALALFTPAQFPDTPPGAPVAAGSLVEVELAGETEAFLLAPAGGGLALEIDGTELSVLTPEAPLRHQLIGLHAGDTLEQPPLRILAIS